VSINDLNVGLVTWGLWPTFIEVLCAHCFGGGNLELVGRLGTGDEFIDELLVECSRSPNDLANDVLEQLRYWHTRVEVQSRRASYLFICIFNEPIHHSDSDNHMTALKIIRRQRSYWSFLHIILFTSAIRYIRYSLYQVRYVYYIAVASFVATYIKTHIGLNSVNYARTLIDLIEHGSSTFGIDRRTCMHTMHCISSLLLCIIFRLIAY